MVENISIVVAIAQNLAIGINNQLLTHIPGDLPRFKQLTTGHTVIMGRKTFESLPKGALPNRRNIVITHNPELQFPNCNMAHSMQECLNMLSPNEKVFVIGGGEIYSLFLPLASKLIITSINKEFPLADAFFPHVDFTKYTLVANQDMAITDKNDFSFSYQEWQYIQ